MACEKTRCVPLVLVSTAANVTQHMISAVPPREYGDRFLAFIYSSIWGNDESKRPPMVA